MLSHIGTWFKDHATAIAATVIAVQNSHLIGGSFGAVLAVVSTVLTAIGASNGGSH